MGAWLSYGLGAINKDLPDFIVLNSAFGQGAQGMFKDSTADSGVVDFFPQSIRV